MLFTWGQAVLRCGSQCCVLWGVYQNPHLLPIWCLKNFPNLSLWVENAYRGWQVPVSTRMLTSSEGQLPVGGWAEHWVFSPLFLCPFSVWNGGSYWYQNFLFIPSLGKFPDHLSPMQNWGVTGVHSHTQLFLWNLQVQNCVGGVWRVELGLFQAPSGTQAEAGCTLNHPVISSVLFLLSHGSDKFGSLYEKENACFLTGVSQLFKTYPIYLAWTKLVAWLWRGSAAGILSWVMCQLQYSLFLPGKNNSSKP